MWPKHINAAPTLINALVCCFAHTCIPGSFGPLKSPGSIMNTWDSLSNKCNSNKSLPPQLQHTHSNVKLPSTGFESAFQTLGRTTHWNNHQRDLPDKEWHILHHITLASALFLEKKSGLKFRTILVAHNGVSRFPAPLAPKISSKSCSFQAFLREKPHFGQILGSGPLLEVKTPLTTPVLCYFFVLSICTQAHQSGHLPNTKAKPSCKFPAPLMI